MATLLTTSYKKIGTISLTYDEVRIYAKYTSQSNASNKTTYKLKTVYYRDEGSLSTSSATSKLDGISKSFGYTTFEKGETTLQELTRTITHNSDGSSPIKSVTASLSMSYGGSGSKTVEITFPKINRLAMVTSASDFTDEENPTLSFENPSDFDVYPYLLFYNENNEVVHDLIAKEKATSSPYTWNITEEERKAIWASTNKQKKYKVRVGVGTYNGLTNLGNSYKEQTMTYVDAEPTYTYTIVDENTKVTDLLGESAEYLVQNVSQPKIIIYPSAKKEATIKNVTISYNSVGSILQTEPYEKSYVANSTDFLVRVYDSRMFYVGQDTITRNIIEYLTVNIDSFSFKRENPTSSNIILNSQIRYKQAIFGSTDNVPTIKWKLGAEGELNTLTMEDYTIDEENNRITISNLVLSDVLPYTSEGRFYLYVNDLLTEDTENDIVIKGIPTCDMGEHDFQVNGELYIANENRENKKEIRDLFFPIGSTYVTSKNENPASYLGGEWELFDKGFKNSYESDTSIFTPVSSACNVSACAIVRAGNTLRIRLGVETAKTFTDTNVELGTLDFSKIGITSTSYTPIPLCGTSNDNGIGRVQLMYNTGVVTWLSLIGEIASLPAEVTVTMDVTIPIGYRQMIDSFCDKFYWKRTA